MINIPNYSEYDHYQKTYLRSANTRQSDRLIPININFPKIENKFNIMDSCQII